MPAPTSGYRLARYKYAPVYIRWIDSAHSSGWQREDDLVWSEETLLYESIGFVVKETDYSVSLVQSKSLYGDTQVDGIMEIPKCAIRKILRLAEIKGR